MKERFTEFPPRIFLRVFVPAAASLAAACSEDPTGEFAPKGRALRFDVVCRMTDGTRRRAVRRAGTKCQGSHASAQTAGRNPGRYVVPARDGLGRDRAECGSGKRRGGDPCGSCEDMSQYGAFEVFGFAYTGAWESSLPANLMNRVKVVVEQETASGLRLRLPIIGPERTKKARFFRRCPGEYVQYIKERSIYE